MHTLTIDPGEGIGPLKLGMGPEDILETLTGLRREWDPAGLNKISITVDEGEDNFYRRYQDNFSFFMVRYQRDRAVEIGVDRTLLMKHVPITLWGREVFQTPAEELVNLLKGHSACICDQADEQLGYNYEFPDVGVRLWREYVYHPKLLKDQAYMKDLWHMLDELKRHLYFDIAAACQR